MPNAKCHKSRPELMVDVLMRLRACNGQTKSLPLVPAAAPVRGLSVCTQSMPKIISTDLIQGSGAAAATFLPSQSWVCSVGSARGPERIRVCNIHSFVLTGVGKINSNPVTSVKLGIVKMSKSVRQTSE